jgi:N-methylhydantoinase B
MSLAPPSLLGPRNRAGKPVDPLAGADADPIQTEVIRQALVAAAEQMKRALVRTAYSPVIYDVYDFACAIYDRRVRLLAQSLGLLHFMGRLSFCVELAVEAVGGEDTLEPGDVLIYNVPYGSGAHAQDAGVVMPAFLDGQLIGYTAIKAHWMDIGAKAPYCSDTTDVYQEGTKLPGVRICRRGEIVDDVFRILVANSRVPTVLAGDLNAEIVGVRTGAAAFAEVVRRHGPDRFWPSVERMLAHGEALVRSTFERIPDGVYTGHGELDDNGITDDRVPFEVSVEVSGSDVVVDYSASPGPQEGPINCPLPATIAATRVAIMMLAGAGEEPNEGHFVPVEVVTSPGSLFHALPPSPCFMYGWPAIQAIEVIFRALADAMPGQVPAGSGGDVAAFVWYGRREATGEQWAGGWPHPIGSGASAHGDGGSALQHVAQTGARSQPVEVMEHVGPWLIGQWELAQDSGGPGRQRGGLGLDIAYEALEDMHLTSVLERTRNAPWGLFGGGEGRPNSATIESPDGTSTPFRKGTWMPVPKGTTVRLHTGGGGGYGPPAERDPEAVRRDLNEGYVSREHAKRHYPHVFAAPARDR